MCKSLSVFVSWLNVLIGVSLPILFIVVHNSPTETFKILRYYFKVAKNVNSDIYHIPLLALSWLALLWPMSSILMVKGIKQNRRDHLIPWICISCILLIVLVLLTFPHWAFITRMSGAATLGLKYSLLFLILIGFLILSLIIIIVQYRKMRAPSIVQPIQIPTKTQTTEDDRRYMPIFDN